MTRLLAQVLRLKKIRRLQKKYKTKKRKRAKEQLTTKLYTTLKVLSILKKKIRKRRRISRYWVWRKKDLSSGIMLLKEMGKNHGLWEIIWLNTMPRSFANFMKKGLYLVLDDLNLLNFFSLFDHWINNMGGTK